MTPAMRMLGAIAAGAVLAAGCATALPVAEPAGAPGDRTVAGGYGRGAVADPLTAHAFAGPGRSAIATIDVELADAARARTIPVRLRVPQPCDATARRPLLLFSHGLGGSRQGGAVWGAHWASHGFAVAHLQHPGSDASLWRGRTPGLEALRAGITAEQFVARIDDVRAAADGLAALAASRPDLACVDATRIGMSGHSFGAQTTQAIAGQALPALDGHAAGPWAREPRVVAAIAFSPSVRDAARGSLATVGVPLLGITGTLDGDVVGTGVTPALRRAVHEALPAGRRALLWLDGADHRVFAGGAPRPASPGRRPDEAVQRAVRAVTLAFWRAALLDDAAARAWLDEGGPAALLGPSDEWLPR